MPRRRRSKKSEATSRSSSSSKRSAGPSKKKARPKRRLPRPKLSRPTLPRPKGPKLPKPPADAWFRFTTRLRAIRYWIREKAQIVWRRLRVAAEAAADWWARRSHTTKVQIYAVAGVAVLYLIIKFIPVPGVPCEISAVKECAPPNDTIAYVPQNAVLYAHVTVNSSSHQWDLEGDLAKQLPNIAALLRQSTSALATPSGKPVDISNQVLPWAKDDIAVLDIPGPKRTTLQAYIVGVGDKSKADQFVASIAPSGGSKANENGLALSVYPGGFATASSSGELLFGNEAAVRAALDAKSGKLPGLDGSAQDVAREALPNVRFAEVYLSPAGVQRFLTGPSSGATQLGTFVDYGATKGMAASATAKDNGIQFNLVSELDAKLEQRSPTVFADLPKFEPGLADQAGTKALAYIGVGDLGPALNKALASAGAGTQGLAGSVRALARSLQQQAGVDPLKDLLPALGGQAALVAEPTASFPFASLIVDGVDEAKANDALARLQQPLLRSLGTEGGRQVPTFQNTNVDGVTVHSVQTSPSVDLSYAVFDRKLVISTQPAGIAQVRSSGDNLAGTGAYQQATERLPGSVSALVFLNLDEVLGLAQQAGLAEDPLYASLSQDISHLRSLGLAVNGDHDQLSTELFVATQH